MCPRRVDENPAHQSSRQRKEVRPISPLDALAVNEPYEHLIDERRRLQRVTGAFTAHVAASQLAELVLDERHQLIDGTVITASPGLEQRGGAQGLIRNDLILPLRQIERRVAIGWRLGASPGDVLAMVLRQE